MDKYINGTDGVYVSDTGIVFYDGEYGRFNYTPRINNCGYGRIAIKIYNKQKEKLVHRLVAEAFIPKRRGRELVNHIDGNKVNNQVENLEWVTSKQNMRHASKKGLMSKYRRMSDQLISNILLEYTGNCHDRTRISKKYGITRYMVTSIMKNNNKKYKKIKQTPIFHT